MRFKPFIIITVLILLSRITIVNAQSELLMSLPADSIKKMTGKDTAAIRDDSLYRKGLITQDVYPFVESIPTVTDPDGKIYPAVRIGSQVWMAENLAYLPAVSPLNAGSDAEAHFYVYGYNGSDVEEAKATDNYKTYGVLYNWPAAMEACPGGWHLPGDNEWKQLEIYLGMSQQQADSIEYRGTHEGGKMKENTLLWYRYYEDTTNRIGFAARPAGIRSSYYPAFTGLEKGCTWWSSTEFNTGSVWCRNIFYMYGAVFRIPENKKNGYSVRCIRD